MVENRRVKLKILVLLLTVIAIHAESTENETVSATTEPVPLSVIQERTAKNNNEVKWLNNLIQRTNVTKDKKGNLTSTKDRAPLNLNLQHMDGKVETTTEGFPESSLECVKYNEDDCRHGEVCPFSKETCTSKGHLQHLGCFAIFHYPLDLVTNSTEKYLPVNQTKVKKMGCMEYQAAHLADCSNTEKCLQERLNVNAVGMCCCSTENCNKEGNMWFLNPDLQRDIEESKHFFVPTPPPAPSIIELVDDHPVLNYLLLTILSLMVVVLILVAIKTPRWYKNYKKRKMEEKHHNVVSDCYGISKDMEEGRMPLVVPEEEIEMQPTPKELPISEWQLLSVGRFGKVYKAKWTSENGDEKWVAVKKMVENQRPCYAAEKTIFESLMEHSKWYSSIVQFVCAEKIGHELWIVTEFHERLSLHDLLRYNVISIAACNRIILSMVDGLSFLHDSRPFYMPDLDKKPIIHRDIKSKNILIKSDMTACIADFGLARFFDIDCERSDLLGQVGTKRYMAPEMLEGAADYNLDAFKAMDVYSMSLVMWEVISRTKLSRTDEVPDYKVPYDWLGPDPLLSDVRRSVCLLKDRPKWRQETQTHDLMKHLTKTVEDMWESEGTARTTAGYVFQRVWTLVMNGVERSEGYHSSGSGEEDDLKVNDANDCDKRMREYHKGEEKLPHPSPDPLMSNCPPPPMVPILTENGIQYTLDDEPKKKDDGDSSALKPMDLSDSAERKNTQGLYYNVELQRFLTEEEGRPLYEEEERMRQKREKERELKKKMLNGELSPEQVMVILEQAEQVEVKIPSPAVSRRSSLTPSGTF